MDRAGYIFVSRRRRPVKFSSWGLSQRLSRVVGPYRAKELSLSGN